MKNRGGTSERGNCDSYLVTVDDRERKERREGESERKRGTDRNIQPEVTWYTVDSLPLSLIDGDLFSATPLCRRVLTYSVPVHIFPEVGTVALISLPTTSTEVYPSVWSFGKESQGKGGEEGRQKSQKVNEQRHRFSLIK